jgi:hypothetical protein
MYVRNIMLHAATDIGFSSYLLSLASSLSLQMASGKETLMNNETSVRQSLYLELKITVFRDMTLCAVKMDAVACPETSVRVSASRSG